MFDQEQIISVSDVSVLDLLVSYAIGRHREVIILALIHFLIFSSLLLQFFKNLSERLLRLEWRIRETI